MRDLDQSYYLSTALQALENAYARNRDAAVGPHISRAIGALQRLMHQAASADGAHKRMSSDPYEMNEFNSAI